MSHFSSYYRVWQKWRNKLWGSTSYFDIYSGSYKSIYFGPKLLLKTQSFEKKRQSFQWREAFGLLFFFLSNLSNVRKQIIRVHKVIWQFCCKRSDRFLGPKRSIETNISIYIYIYISFHGDKCFWPVVPRIIECHKHQGTVYKGPQKFPQLVWKF